MRYQAVEQETLSLADLEFRFADKSPLLAVADGGTAHRKRLRGRLLS
jgi:hypothetical protein